ncbi:MAG TPA: glycosyltransferase family 2 protein [Sphingomicrobium sp.]|nr:glycosyltransferase family 2 protein [Sphingomicrobium sp.]
MYRLMVQQEARPWGTLAHRRASFARNPRVSVISHFFNAERYFVEAIESVLAQEFEDFELLLVDDGATDASSAIAQEYASAHPNRVCYIHHPGRENRGISASRNLGLSAARGEIVGFIDADDRWRPNKLGDQVTLFDEHPDASAVCGAVNYWASWSGGRDRVYRTGHAQDRKVYPPNALLAWYPLGNCASPSMSDIMFRREAALKVGGFDESFARGYTEYPFLTKFYLTEIIYVSSDIWSDYRQHDESCMAELTRQGSDKLVRARFLDSLEDRLARTSHEHHISVHLALERARRRSTQRTFKDRLNPALERLRGLVRERRS